MTKIVNSSAGNSIFDINGNAINNSAYKPNINGGSSANLGSNDRLNNAPIGDETKDNKTKIYYNQNLSDYTYRLDTELANISYSTIILYDKAIVTVTFNNSAAIVKFNEVKKYIGYPIVIRTNFVSSPSGLFYTKLGYLSYQNNLNKIIFIVPGKFSGVDSSGTFGSFTYIFEVLKISDDRVNSIMRIDNTPVFNNTRDTNKRETVKTVKTATAIRNNKLHDGDFDTNYPETSNDTTAIGIANDNVLNKTNRKIISDGVKPDTNV